MDIVDLMHEATTGLQPSPMLLHEVRKGGQRRRRLRRFAAAGAASALVAVGVVSYPMLTTPDFTKQYAGPLFDGRTHGDLQDDSTFLRQAITAWEGSHESSDNAFRGIFDDLRGKPRVVWAGTTPVGNAALIQQDAFLHRHGNIQLRHEGMYTLLGFIGVDADGKPVVVGDAYPPDPGDGLETNAWFVDPARTVLAVAENGESYGVSTGWLYDTRAHRTFTPVPAGDGVGVLRLPTPATAAVHVARLPALEFTDLRMIAGAADFSTNNQPLALPWRNRVTLAGAAAGNGNALQALSKAVSAQINGQAWSIGYGSWSVRGATPDGRQFLASEVLLENDPSHVYVLLGDDLITGPEVDPRAPLPVAVRLPDAQGWVIAGMGSALEYRVGPGAWISAERDAALLPPQATAVRVTPKDGMPELVDLGRP